MLFDSDENNGTLSTVDWASPNRTRYYNDSDYDFTSDEDPWDCYRRTKREEKFIAEVAFWVDGVITCLIAFVGFFANVISALILGK